MKHLQPEARPPRSLVPWKKGELSCGNLGFDHFLGGTPWLTLPGGPDVQSRLETPAGHSWNRRDCRRRCRGGGTLGASTVAAARGGQWSLAVPIGAPHCKAIYWISSDQWENYDILYGKMPCLDCRIYLRVFCCCFLVFLSLMRFKSSPHPGAMFGLVEHACSQVVVLVLFSQHPRERALDTWC